MPTMFLIETRDMEPLVAVFMRWSALFVVWNKGVRQSRRSIWSDSGMGTESLHQ